MSFSPIPISVKATLPSGVCVQLSDRQKMPHTLSVKKIKKELAEYLKYKPFGEGLGLGGVEARKYGSRLTTLIPHDSFYVKTWMETGIVGLVLFLIIYVSALLRGCYLIMFRIKNNELRGILTAIACGIFGMMISAYGNAFFFQFPTGFIIILFLSVLINGEHIDQLLTEKLKTEEIENIK